MFKLDRVYQILRVLAGSSLVMLGAVSNAAAQVQPNPPTGLAVDDGTSDPTPPPSSVMFFDNFDYVVNKFDAGETKVARFNAAGWTGLKDETTRPGGANGYLYTRTDAPGCGQAPSGRMLTMEGRPRTLGFQTDFYLQLGNGSAGDIPARAFIQFDICIGRAGAEMSDVASVHDKLLYPLFGSRDAYPMATIDNAWLQSISSHAYRGATMISQPEPGAFTFMNNATTGPDGPRAQIADQIESGSGSQMTPNVGEQWIRPNRWYTVRFLFDVSGPQGIYRVWVATLGEPLALVSDFTGGITPGFTYQTAPLDRQGAKYLRMPTTWGTVSGSGPDRWINIDNMRLASTEEELR